MEKKSSNNPLFFPDHAPFIRRCIERARSGQGLVGNGALVGSVLVRSGTILAEAYHEGFGKLHAERALLESFDQPIESTDILSINLEPCCHTGKTPPCTDIIIERGIKTIVFGMYDPDSRMSGKGIEILRSKGINVIGPVLPEECARLNRGFISVRSKSRPWITLHKAQTVDGRIAKPDGSPLKITSEEQDKWSHHFLRARHDAILVGSGTILKDDPLLNTRFDHKGAQPLRIILDASGKITPQYRVCSDQSARTMIITSPGQFDRVRSSVPDHVSVQSISIDSGHFNWHQLWKVLMTPNDDFYGITSILVEGGAKTWGQFKKTSMIDEEVILTGNSIT